MTVDYGRVLKRAVNVTWQHKVLWVFGVAAALFGAKGGSDGGGGGGSPGLQYVLSGADFDRWGLTPWFQRIPFGPEKWRYSGAFPNWETLAPIGLSLLAAIAVIGLLALVVSVIVRYTSLGALVGMVDEVEETEETSFKSGLSAGSALPFSSPCSCSCCCSSSVWRSWWCPAWRLSLRVQR